MHGSGGATQQNILGVNERTVFADLVASLINDGHVLNQTTIMSCVF